MTDEISAAGSAAPNSTPAAAGAPSVVKAVENPAGNAAASPAGANATAAPADDFDENLIPEGSRENFRKFREGQQKKFKDSEERISKEVRQRFEAEARAKQFEQRLQPAEDDKELGPEPDYHDFKTIEEYRDALKTWNKKAAIAEYRGQQTQAKTQEEQHAAAVKLQAKGRSAMQKYQDYQQIVQPLVPVVDQIPTLRQFVHESDTGTDVLYQLCKNPPLLEALRNMPPIAQIKELFRMETAMSASPAKAVSKAPDPMNPVNTGGDGNVKSILDLVKKDDVSDFVAKENRKLLRGKKGE